MRQTACHCNHLVVHVFGDIPKAELVVDVVKGAPISASDSRTHVVVDVHKIVGDVHIRTRWEGNPVTCLIR